MFEVIKILRREFVEEGIEFHNDSHELILNLNRIDYIEACKYDYIVMDESINKVYVMYLNNIPRLEKVFISDEQLKRINFNSKFN